jgi:HTH-type transcriptional regulator/antitoxin HipB
MSSFDDNVPGECHAMQPIQTTRAFGSAIRRARKNHGLSQAQLAAKAGVGRPWLSELETGKRTAELGRALSVLSALDLAITFVPSPTPDASGVDLRRILGEDT